MLAMVLLTFWGGKKSLLVLDRFLHSLKRRGTASNLPHACHGSAYLLGGKKSLLVLDRFLHSLKRGVQHQIFLILAMVLLTFWGDRKASLCLTDFFIASQHQILLVLAIFLPPS